MKGTLTTLVFGHPEIDIRYSHRRNGRVFRFASRLLEDPAVAARGISALIRPVSRILEIGLKEFERT